MLVLVYSDEERALNNAFRGLEEMGYSVEERAMDELENEVLVGVGTEE